MSKLLCEQTSESKRSKYQFWYTIKLEHNESSPKVNVREVLNATHCVGSAETIRPTVLNITQGGADFIRFGLVHEEAHFVAFYTSMHSILLRRDR